MGFWNWLCGKPKQEWWEREMEVRKSLYPEDQKRSDDVIEHAGLDEAADIFYQWKQDQKDGLFSIPIASKIYVTFIPQYPGQKSRWSDGAYRKFVMDEFKRLKEEYGTN